MFPNLPVGNLFVEHYDRRDEDIKNIGYQATRIFDEIIVRHDKDTRGRKKYEFTKLILDSIRDVNATITINVISAEREAIQLAMDNAKEGL